MRVRANTERVGCRRCAATALVPKRPGAEKILFKTKIQGDCMYPPMTTEGLGVLCVGASYIGAVVADFAVVTLRYGAGHSVPIVSEAWTCPAATANLFDNTSSFIIFD